LISYQIEQSFEAVVIENDDLMVKILPQLGGKIYSLVNKRTGREWMDRPSGRVFRRPVPGTSWGDWDRCGWDELFPSIDACNFPGPYLAGTAVPDHGEVWSLPWSFSQIGTDGIRLYVNGNIWPYRLEKTVCISDNSVEFNYKLTNYSKEPLPYIWAPHPILAGSDSFEIKLPIGIDKAITSFSVNERLGKRGGIHNWPLATDCSGKMIDLSNMPARHTNAAEKLYLASPLMEGWCLVRDRITGEQFKMTFDPAQLPYLGIWINAGGWDGEYHIALEPATGFLDNLEESYACQKCAILAGGETRSWWLQVHIT